MGSVPTVLFSVGSFVKLLLSSVCLVLVVSAPVALSWSKEGHMLTCRIAQKLLDPEAAEARCASGLIRFDTGTSTGGQVPFTSLTPLTKLATSPTQETATIPMEQRTCVAGAVRNFTNQLLHYRHGTSDRKYNFTEALLFLSHFMGDIHQPMHVGFTSDQGGNTINLHWFRHKSNLHHVWDREIILTALADYYDKDMDVFQEDLQNNFTSGIWSDDTSSWGDCDDLFSCPTKYATESITLACKWGYEGVNEGDTLSDNYFNSRMPIVAKRIAQGGVRTKTSCTHFKFNPICVAVPHWLSEKDVNLTLFTYAGNIIVLTLNPAAAAAAAAVTVTGETPLGRRSFTAAVSLKLGLFHAAAPAAVFDARAR
uniref:Aspergillus nuclease S1 n=1 Tax=Ananas comosus var. bracteatus TaxID=296719 RepID=A0A6V7QWQ8_ANACO